MRQAQAQVRDEAQAKMDEYSNAIGGEMAIRNVDRVEVDVYVAQIVQTNRSTLSKIKLVEHGVSPDVIEASTERSLSVSVRVSRRRTTDVIPGTGQKKKKALTPPVEGIAIPEGSIPGYEVGNLAPDEDVDPNEV